MPYIWLENDELRAVRAVIDWRSRIGQPLDWAAYDRGMARLATGPTHHVLPAGSRARKWSRTRGGDGVSTRPVDG